MGIVIVGKRDALVRERVANHFTDYKLLELEPFPNEFYRIANETLQMLGRRKEPVFLILEGDSLFLALLAAKLARTRRYYLGAWDGNRYRILEVP